MEDIEIEQRAKEYKNAVKELKPLNNHKLLYEEGFNQGIKTGNEFDCACPIHKGEEDEN